MQTHPKTVGGLLLDEAIGQYDTYTPLQVAQYMSTIANGGNRIQPRVVKSVHFPTNKEEVGPVVKKYEPKVLNTINNSKADIDRVKMGLKWSHQQAGLPLAGSVSMMSQGKRVQPKPSTMVPTGAGGECHVQLNLWRILSFFQSESGI